MSWICDPWPASAARRMSKLILLANTHYISIPIWNLAIFGHGILSFSPTWRLDVFSLFSYDHITLQFILLLSGSIEIKTLETEVMLQAGEAIFINKNIIHLVMPKGNCHYNSFIFPHHFLKFYFKSPAETLAKTITGNPHLSVYHFIPGTDWCDEVISSLQKSAISEKNKTESYVYEVLVQLSTLWYLLHIWKKELKIAAIPDAKTTDVMPPSNFVILSSKAVTVGFATLV